MINNDSATAVAAMSTEEQHVDASGLAFPLARIKKIMKTDKDVSTIQNEALLATCAAAEVFLEFVTAKASALSDKEKRKTVNYKDIATAVDADSRLHFLSELIPKTMSVTDALEHRRKVNAELGINGEAEDETEGEGMEGIDESHSKLASDPINDEAMMTKADHQPAAPYSPEPQRAVELEPQPKAE